ncbi:MAG: TrmH family RNA methyltransferase [Actinomycetota bacterium]
MASPILEILGQLSESAAAFGADGVIMAERRAAAMTASAWKSSAGAAARMQIAQVTNLPRAIDEAKKVGCFVVGLDGESDQSLSEMKLANESLMIVVGSEGKGLSRLVRGKVRLGTFHSNAFKYRISQCKCRGHPSLSTGWMSNAGKNELHAFHFVVVIPSLKV